MTAVTEFFVLSPPDRTTRLAEWGESVDLGEPITCPIHSGHRRAGARRSKLSIVLPDVEIADFVWTWAGECMIAAHVADAFNEKGITGFDLRPVEVEMKRKRDEEPVPLLWELVITGWGGIAPAASGVSLDVSKSCTVCGLLVYTSFTDASRLVAEEQWDGSDVFMVWPLPKFVMVSNRLAELIRSEGWKGMHLQRLADLKPTAAQLSPGRMSFYMPMERARQLGEPLGIT